MFQNFVPLGPESAERKNSTWPFLKYCAFVLSLCFWPIMLSAQTAQVGGAVHDQSGAVIPRATIEFRNQGTGSLTRATTNSIGIYHLIGLDPGTYNATVQVPGFEKLTRENIVFQVGDKDQIDFAVRIGETGQTVTVDGSGQTINTVDASVGTVINRQFVEDMPLNGRSFQSLILLSPGAVSNTPQTGGNTPPSADLGQYSVNGMRSDANNFMVDGASASNAPTFASGAGSAGMMSSSTMLGTTQAMISVDAMEEFRISTSTYSAEYGRQPGAQVVFRSRSGSNIFHGTVFDYLRNSAFDANNWFNTYSTPVVATPAERQNDFGGTVGGPISIPHLYSGKDRTFFFFSYEGLRLTSPLPSSIYDVPSNGTHNTGTYSNAEYKNLRHYAPAALQPALNAFPLPNCDTTQDAQCVDLGEGGSPYISSPESDGVLDSVSARIDYQILPSMRVFARYQDTTSSTSSDSGPNVMGLVGRNRIYLLGANNTFGGAIANELRLQYSPALFHVTSAGTTSGGAVPLNLFSIQGVPDAGETEVNVELPSETQLIQESYGSTQYQPNATDSVTWAHGKHLFKFGADYRQTTAYYGDGALSRFPFSGYTYTTAAKLLSNSSSTEISNSLRLDPTTKNLGLFAQDEWRILPRLNLSLGLRWDLNPPPSISTSEPYYTYAGDINNPSSLTLSAPNAPFYRTIYTNFAPRFGMALVIDNQPGHELVFRGGGGVFFDTIAVAQLFGNAELIGVNYKKTTTTVFPQTGNAVDVPVQNPPVAPYELFEYPNLRLVPPVSYQWNASLEQAFGAKQTLTIGYVASLGTKLTTFQEYQIPKGVNPNFSDLYLYQNGPGSNYNSLQVKFQRQLSNGLQAIASYTWSHAIDWASTEDYEEAFPLQRGNSNYDVRNNFSGALVYNLPTSYSNRIEKAILGSWNADLLFVARSAFPYEPVGPSVVNPVTGDVINGELNYNGKNPYVHAPGIPGGRQIDPSIFSVTQTPLGVGNAPRNFLRGFGEAQANIALQREFPLYERAKLQFRAEAFNIANHPNFGTVNTTCGVTAVGATCNNPIMGQATNTLSVGLGGMSSLYQQGGPRSLQFMLKLQF
jgi:hypothetical protein